MEPKDKCDTPSVPDRYDLGVEPQKAPDGLLLPSQGQNDHHKTMDSQIDELMSYEVSFDGTLEGEGDE